MKAGEATADRRDLLALLKEVGAYLEGHFELTSGLHSDAYIQKFRFLDDPAVAGEVVQGWLPAFHDLPATRVVGPAMGGLLLAYELARQLHVSFCFAEKVPGRGPGQGRFGFGRGFSLGPADRAIVVDDIVTTGGSVLDSIDAVLETGAQIVGVGVVVDRSAGLVRHKIRRRAPGAVYSALLEVDMPAWPPETCPKCAAGEPLTTARHAGSVEGRSEARERQRRGVLEWEEDSTGGS